LTLPSGSDSVQSPLSRDGAINRQRVYHLTILEDGTTVLVGSPVTPRRPGDSSTNGVSILEFSGDTETGWLVCVHLLSAPEVERLLSLPGRHQVFFDVA
jgi:hypothetical protein